MQIPLCPDKTGINCGENGPNRICNVDSPLETCVQRTSFACCDMLCHRLEMQWASSCTPSQPVWPARDTPWVDSGPHPVAYLSADRCACVCGGPCACTLCLSVWVASCVLPQAHKCAELAALTLQLLGAKGVCCQKVSEAEAMAEGGIRDILVTNEIVSPRKIQRLVGLAAHGGHLKRCRWCDHAYCSTVHGIAMGTGCVWQYFSATGVEAGLMWQNGEQSARLIPHTLDIYAVAEADYDMTSIVVKIRT
jgi:hypothetical protein